MACLYKHLIIVHGIGDQKPNETGISFMSEFIRALPPEEYEVIVDNLVEGIDADNRPRPAFIIVRRRQDHFVLGFSELYWQPITNKFVDDNGQPPIPIFPWAHSINCRLRDRPDRKGKRTGLTFRRAREVIDNLEKLLKAVARLARIYKRSEMLNRALIRFGGDVQMYAESDEIRYQVNTEFLALMARVRTFAERVAQNPNYDLTGMDPSDTTIYVVAHSEGTVVAVNSLLQAASLAEVRNAQIVISAGEEEWLQRYSGSEPTNKWLPRVRGLVTLGSPLDKHYTIWSHRFRSSVLRHPLAEKIPWLNFWDTSDPVGYGLKSVFENVDEREADAEKVFAVKYDSGFSRYFVPVKAHVEYWRDSSIHRDIAGLMFDSVPSPVTGSHWWCEWLQSPVFAGLYLAIRVGTVGAMLLFGNRLLSFAKNTGLISGFRKGNLEWLEGFFGKQASPWIPLFTLIAVLVIVKCIRYWRSNRAEQGRLSHSFEEPWISFNQGPVFWAITGLVWVLGIWFCILNPMEYQERELKDAIGYLTGLVVAWMIWGIHSCVHKGLVQMWRYTRGVDTEYEGGWKQTLKSKVTS